MLAIASILTAGMLTGCDGDQPDTSTDGNGKPPDGNAQTELVMPDSTGMPEFSGENAYSLIQQQIAFGTREPNSEGAKKALAWYLQEFAKYADTVVPQPFTHNGYEGEVLNLTNVVASFNASATHRLLLCTHWDSRPRADEDSDSTKHHSPILAVNDGLSGVGVLLELARILKENPPSIGVDIVLFDGEDYGNSHIDNVDQYFLGAKHFASSKTPGYQPMFGILLDMVGDRDAEFAKDQYSLEKAPAYVDLVWKAAGKLGLQTFKQRVSTVGISDDHIPLNEIGKIPTIDIIDAELVGARAFDPRRHYWHTSGDNLDNIGRETLDEVGTLLTYLIYRVIPAASGQSA